MYIILCIYIYTYLHGKRERERFVYIGLYTNPSRILTFRVGNRLSSRNRNRLLGEGNRDCCHICWESGGVMIMSEVSDLTSLFCWRKFSLYNVPWSYGCWIRLFGCWSRLFGCWTLVVESGLVVETGFVQIGTNIKNIFPSTVRVPRMAI